MDRQTQYYQDPSLFNFIYRFNAILIQTLGNYFVAIYKLVLKGKGKDPE